MMTKLVIFDAGGVLYKGNNQIADEALAKFLKKHGIYNSHKSGSLI